MIKKAFSLGLTVLSIACSTGAIAAPTIVNGGTVNFTGSVVNAACAVSTESTNMSVDLGQVRTAKLSSVGSTNGNTSFTITLKDCDTAVSKNASISFQGSTVAGDAETLALGGSGSGSAEGVGIRILYSGVPLALDGSAYSPAQTLTENTNSFPLIAQYYATGSLVKPGDVTAQATFKVKYE